MEQSRDLGYIEWSFAERHESAVALQVTSQGGRTGDDPVRQLRVESRHRVGAVASAPGGIRTPGRRIRNPAVVAYRRPTTNRSPTAGWKLGYRPAAVAPERTPLVSLFRTYNLPILAPYHILIPYRHLLPYLDSIAVTPGTPTMSPAPTRCPGVSVKSDAHLKQNRMPPSPAVYWPVS